MRRIWIERRGLELVLAVLFAGGVATACGDEPTRSIDPDCVIPTTTSFVDSAQGRVVVTNFSYAPANITIKAGQTVRWIHCGPENDGHTVTADAGAATPPGNSGEFVRTEEYSYTFPSTGTFPYHCIPHEVGMEGTVTVVPAT